MIGLPEAFAMLEGMRDELGALVVRARFDTADGKVELEVNEGGRVVIVEGVVTWHGVRVRS